MPTFDWATGAAQAASRATDLIADFQQRHEAWQRQGEDLARLRADARAAASREAAAILTSARADIRRIVVDARSALLVLTAQLEAITGQSAFHLAQQNGVADHHGDADVPESVLKARRDLQKLLEEIRPELDELAAHVRLFDGPAAPAETPATTSPASPRVTSETAHVQAQAPVARSSAEDTRDDDRWSESLEAFEFGDSHRRLRIRFGKGTVLAALALAAAILAGAGGWFLWGILGGPADLAPPLASIPAAPRIKPAWLDDRIPTLTASVIALPSTSFVDRAAVGSPSTAGAPGTVSLDIEVQRDAWMQSSVDNAAAAERVFRHGETLHLIGAHDISIAARDAGAVIVSLNGGPPARLGQDGQVVTRRFP